MKHIKSTETIGQELGLTNTNPRSQYAALVDLLGGKIETIANILNTLRTETDQDYDDLYYALRNIERTIEDVVK